MARTKKTARKPTEEVTKSNVTAVDESTTETNAAGQSQSAATSGEEKDTNSNSTTPPSSEEKYWVMTFKMHSNVPKKVTKNPPIAFIIRNATKEVYDEDGSPYVGGTMYDEEGNILTDGRWMSEDEIWEQMSFDEEDSLSEELADSSGCPFTGNWGAGDWSPPFKTELVGKQAMEVFQEQNMEYKARERYIMQ
jgi:hypothetical protein